jgi:hypothetical protein
VRALRWDQLTLVFATQFAGEIAAVASGGDERLRKRLGLLGEDERRVLRQALDEPAA